MSPDTKKPRPKYLGDPSARRLDHGEGGEDARTDDLNGTSAHGPAEDLRAEEPCREAEGSTESS